jgi:threonine dehydrogenase-like Zn-dependent dehydrogenase
MPQRAVAVGNRMVALQPYDLPPLSDRSVHIRTLYSLISQGTELATIRGYGARFQRSWSEELRLFGVGEAAPKSFPANLGYSSVGRVEAAGAGVSKVKPGDVVWLDRPHQEEHIVPEEEAWFGLCRDDVDPCRYAFRVLTKVALAGVHDAHPFLGGSAAVVGLGIIGQITVDLLQLAGLARIYAIDPSEARRSGMIAPNASPIDPAQGDPALAVKQASGSVDVAIEASGSYAGLSTAIRCVGVGGRVVTVSTYGGVATALHLGEEYHRNRIELVSSMSVNNCPHRGFPVWDIPRLLATAKQMLDSGVLTPERLVSDVVPFADLPAVYDELLGGEAERMAILVFYAGASK